MSPQCCAKEKLLSPAYMEGDGGNVAYLVVDTAKLSSRASLRLKPLCSRMPKSPSSCDCGNNRSVLVCACCVRVKTVVLILRAGAGAGAEEVATSKEMPKHPSLPVGFHGTPPPRWC